MITFHATHVTLPVDTAKALLLFAAGKKPMRPEFSGVGISKNRLVATDGCAAVVFHGSPSVPLTEHGQPEHHWFLREYVERELKLAQLDKREVTLHFDKTSNEASFPDIDTLVPQVGTWSASEPIPLVAEYLAKLVAVQQACFPKSKDAPPGWVDLTGCGGRMQPLRFDVGNTSTFSRATVIFMPTGKKT
jgi:hypothetical protein